MSKYLRKLIGEYVRKIQCIDLKNVKIVALLKSIKVIFH